MKRLLLLTAVSAMTVTVSAEIPVPKQLENAVVYAMSANGDYAVAESDAGVKIFNLATGQEDVYESDGMSKIYIAGIGKCVSDNGIVVGTTDNVAAEYWKDGEWFTLQAVNEGFTNVANAITPDGSRICGSVGVTEVNYNIDVLMQAPVVWNAEGDGFGAPVMLPHPELDFTGRVPQYITAVDISEDGKTIIGQVRDAFGAASYPIVYTENADGEWSYTIPHQNLLYPEGTVFPKFPGDGPAAPAEEDYMTPEEMEAYDAALNEFYDSGYTLPYPVITDYMSEAGRAAYEKDMAEYREKYDEWENAFNAWITTYETCVNYMPGYLYNSVRISPDGKTFGVTIGIPDPDPEPWGYRAFGYKAINVWLFDVNSENIVKYDMEDDLNLTYLANDGVALASSSVGEASNSFVLSGGKAEGMHQWMSNKCPEYGEWMTENMTFEYEAYVEDPETGDYVPVIKNEFMSGRATGTPDLSKIILGVQNLWDNYSDGMSFVFDIKTAIGTGVGSVDAADKEVRIYDLSGRRLKSADAPGVYIINGEKKMVH